MSFHTKNSSLTSSQLERWFSTVERDVSFTEKSHTDLHLSTQFLCRFGLKHPQDVIELLKSPVGETILMLVGQELMKNEALNEYQMMQFRIELTLI